MRTDYPTVTNRVASDSDLTVASAPFLIFGILNGLTVFLAFILPAIILRCVPPHFTLDLAAVACLSVAMCALGVAIRRRWRFALVFALPCCTLGLLNFPVGTLLCGWATHTLWRHRRLFYPFRSTAAIVSIR